MAYEDENLLYEVNENGERVVVKSIDASRRAYLRFTNCTSRKVDIWWRDYSGMRQHYGTLKPGDHIDVATFITHPWEFTDNKINEVYVINNKTIFRAPVSVADMRYRTNWNITIPVRTLRYTALLYIASFLPNMKAADKLELPRSLATDLRAITAQLKRRSLFLREL